MKVFSLILCLFMVFSTVNAQAPYTTTSGRTDGSSTALLDAPDPILPLKAVGGIAGAFNVSALGAANYTLPLFTPSGINGLQPSLTVAYNSQSDNGIMGVGWSLNAVIGIGLSFRDRMTFFKTMESALRARSCMRICSTSDAISEGNLAAE